MIEKQSHGTNFENFIKLMLDRFDIPSKKDINLLNTRLDKLEQLLYQKHPTLSGKEKIPLKNRHKSASSIVLDVIGNYRYGTNFKTIRAATGFNDKKLRNIIYRLNDIKKIKRVKRGIYKKI